MKITKKQIENEYLKKGKSIRQTAKALGCKYDFIRDRMVKFDIKRRNASDSNSKYSKILTKCLLKKEYISNKKSADKIAKEINIGASVIKRYLKRFNIKTRTHKESHSIRHPHNYAGGRPHCKCGKIVWYGFENCKSCARKKQWKDPEYRTKTVKLQRKGLNVKMNKAEAMLLKLLNKLCPKEYKFVGDGKVVIDRFNPDFINCNGQKKIIELFGNYWHNLPASKKRDKRRIKTYRKYGYKTLVIWAHELNKTDKLTAKVLNFGAK